MDEANPGRYSLPSDRAIEVYPNDRGQIVIEQENIGYGDDNVYIVFSPDRADRIIEFIQAVRDEIITDRADSETVETPVRRYVPGMDP